MSLYCYSTEIMTSAAEDGRKITEQPASGHFARMDWARSVVDYLKVDEAIAESTPVVAAYQQEGRVQLEKALAQRLIATFGHEDALVVLGHTYAQHRTVEDADHAKSLFDQRHRELYGVRDPKSYEMIGELNIASMLRGHFWVEPDFALDYPSDAQRWGKAVVKHQQYVGTVRSIVEAAHPMHRAIADYAAPIAQQVEEDLDYQLLERMQENFGPFTHNVLNTLYGEFESEEARQQAEQALLADLSERPWSSSVYRTILAQRSDSGQVVNPSEDPDRAGEQLRFLLKTYTPGQINPIGVIFEEESRVANSLR